MNELIYVSVHFSPLTDLVVRGTWGTIQQRSSLMNELISVSVHFSPLTGWVVGGWGSMGDDSAEILFQSLLQEALVSSLAWAGM